MGNGMSVRKGRHLVSRGGLAQEVYAFSGCLWSSASFFRHCCAPRRLHRPMDATGSAGWFHCLFLFAIALDFQLRSNPFFNFLFMGGH